jgi:hypothetical protein
MRFGELHIRVLTKLNELVLIKNNIILIFFKKIILDLTDL